MTRVEFTKKITLLLLEMIKRGDNPIIDYVKRSDWEQHRLFVLGKSKCDGHKNHSMHQFGKAADIYFIGEDDKIDWSREKYEYWHKVWHEKFGGKKIIDWDIGHYE